MSTTQRAQDRDFVTALARGLRVIESFGADRSKMSLADVARSAGLPRAAARRSLITLERLGYVASRDGNFFLAPGILRLGYAYLSSSSLVEAAQPILESVTRTVHESASMSVLDGSEIVYVARSPTDRILSIRLGVGARLPAYCTSMGRVLLTALPDDEVRARIGTKKLEKYTERTVTKVDELMRLVREARKTGHSIVDQELEFGLRSIAVAVQGPDQRPVAAINIGAHASRVSKAELTSRYLPILKKAASELSRFVSLSGAPASPSEV